MVRARTVFWKEVKDLSRDYRTIAYVVLLPLVALPGMALLSGGLYTAQIVTVGIVDEDGSQLSKAFVEGLAGYIVRSVQGASVEVVVGGRGDFTVIVPRGFGESLSELDGRTYLTLSYSPGPPIFSAIESAVRSYASAFERAVVESRVSSLASAAGVEIDVASLLDPIEVRVSYVTPEGAPVGREAGVIAFSARIIAFSLFFVVNPAVVFMSDAVVGEKERRSLERLLVTPASTRDVLAGKLAASLLLSLAAAVADSIGIIAFFILSGASFEVGLGLAATWAASTIVLVAFTSGLVAALSAWSGSLRSAQSSSFAVLMVALAVYFSSLIVDFESLPGWAKAVLLAVPYTHASIAVFNASFGDVLGAALHLGVLAAFTLLSFMAALKMFEPEKLVAFK